MSSWRAPALGAAALLLPTVLVAQEFELHGAGSQKCAAYNETRQAEPAHTQFIEWAQGYMAAYTIATGGKAANFNREGTEIVLDSACQRFPNKLVAEIVRGGVQGQMPSPPAKAAPKPPTKGT